MLIIFYIQASLLTAICEPIAEYSDITCYLLDVTRVDTGSARRTELKEEKALKATFLLSR